MLPRSSIGSFGSKRASMLSAVALTLVTATPQRINVSDSVSCMSNGPGSGDLPLTMTSLPIRRFIPEQMMGTASFAALGSSLCGSRFPTTILKVGTSQSCISLRRCVAAPLRLHRSPRAAEPKSLVYRRRAGLIYQTGTAQATAHKEERIVATKVPNVLDATLSIWDLEVRTT